MTWFFALTLLLRYSRRLSSVRAQMLPLHFVKLRTGREDGVASTGKMIGERKRVLGERFAGFGLVFANCVGRCVFFDDLH